MAPTRYPAHTAAIILFVCALGGAALIPAYLFAGAPGDDYTRSIEEWHRDRIERLTKADGYLSLVGLYPLEEGANRIGSGKSNQIVFPTAAPKFAGTIYVKNGELELAAMPGVTITRDGKAVDKERIDSDAGGKPTVLEMGRYLFYVIDREGEFYVRLKDRKSELREGFEGVERFPVDPKWRVEAHFEPYDPPKLIRVPTVLGYEHESVCSGAIAFDLAGETHRLEPMSENGEFFIVFGDQTSGLETYGGGRFLYATLPDDSGKVVLDFNKAYNPPCAFTPYATCPLPHKANILDVRIEAGEKAYGGGH